MVTGIGGERRAAGLVALRGGTSERRVRRVSPPACRCRPGDVAEWVRLDLPAGQADALRGAAADAAASLDAWLAVMLEFSISLRVLGEELGSADAARTRLSRKVGDCAVEVARLPEWRAWQSSLSRRVQPGGDELPEVVLPQRLLVRSGGPVDVSGALKVAGDWQLARGCELAACGRGQTLEAFALQIGLSENQWPGRG